MASTGFEDKEGDWFVALTTFLGYGMLVLIGVVEDFLENPLAAFIRPKEDYATFQTGFQAFYVRHMYNRIRYLWQRPINTHAGARIGVVHDKFSCQHPEDTGQKVVGEVSDCLNLGSYNYLGFCEPGGPCEEDVLKCFDTYSVSTTTPTGYGGRTELLERLENVVAGFLHKEASMCFGMGWGTNLNGIATMAGKGTLIISDSLNHSSIVAGSRASAARIKPFPHNDVVELEKVIRYAISRGQPRTHKPWDKIIIICEGVYSMEGEVCVLQDIVALKNKYKCYLYVDEAHSIGALGATGRGICEHTGVPFDEIDLLMGTFTKSFGAIGGYIAGDKNMIAYLKNNSPSRIHSAGLAPACIQQILTAFKIIKGDDGTTTGKQKMDQLKKNSNMFRNGLMSMGLTVLGDHDSPIVPVMLVSASRLNVFMNECFKKGIAVVVVGFPACPILASRVRFCISAGHTEEDLKQALVDISEIADRVHCKYQAPGAWFYRDGRKLLKDDL